MRAVTLARALLSPLEYYTVGQVIAFARRLGPGLEERDFADAGRLR